MTPEQLRKLRFDLIVCLLREDKELRNRVRERLEYWQR